ncbi:3-isopropylmalate dehydrogenase [Tistlia consotensis]|uniref:3-isopropylmalate dehydrogenase n=1 Tax=Tistlia consotensis USBA 355 TaxID=560819 RepID=A0A1Y6BGF6_9PROT|nr:3-isopropylmalate dehydrogenase [Tistlia consotensis]SMF10085.1 3-isopropylmalate dehydrogenase [Tistlia consotensis USBA 355]SNR34014.1 3-isopropylmalate dehydrogenase [Tistlia consotensis]
MPANKSLLVLPGDGIGPEVMGQVRRVVDWMDKRRAVSFDVTEDLVGGAAIDVHGIPVTDATVEKAMNVDAVLLGAVGGPKWDNLDFSKKPERGLLRLRKDLQLYANLRPALCFEALVEASTLKPEIVSGLDIMIVRELTGGVYFGEPRGIETLPNGERRGVNTQVYTTSEIRRVAAVAFELARKRGNRVTSCEKANVMESGVLWREEVQKLHDESFGDVELSHMYADNAAMQLVRNPKQFDVIVTDNLFGDILSDEASMLTGSLGMLPSASLGDVDETGRRKALYEPVHGSAPDIAGSGKANPIATILSLAMALRYSFDLADDADLVEEAVKKVLAKGIRTADIQAPGSTVVSTGQMGDALLAELEAMAA